MYRGKVALEVAEAQHLMEGLDWQGAIKDIQASVKWLKESGSSKVFSFLISVCVSALPLYVFLTQIVLFGATRSFWLVLEVESVSLAYLPSDSSTNQLGLSYPCETIIEIGRAHV